MVCSTCVWVLSDRHTNSIETGKIKIVCMHSSASGGWEDSRLFTSSLVP